MNIIFGKMTPPVLSFYMRWDTNQQGLYHQLGKVILAFDYNYQLAAFTDLHKSRRCDLTAGNSAKLCPLLGDLRTPALALFSWATSDRLAQQSL